MPESLWNIDYGWLREHGFHRLEKQERQQYHSWRRCIALETIEDEHFMVASEDLCIDVSPNREPWPQWWFVWLTRASSQNHQASVWLHVRHMRFTQEIELLYEGLTGRKFGPKHWDRNRLAPPVNALWNSDGEQRG